MDKPLYYVEDGHIYQRPTDTLDDNGKVIGWSMSFRICEIDENLSPGSAQIIADMMNAGKIALEAKPTKMSQGFKKIALRLIDDLDQTQCNAGCNDFELVRFIPDPDERRAIALQYFTSNGDISDYDPTKDYAMFYDFALTTLLKDWIEENA